MSLNKRINIYCIYKQQGLHLSVDELEVEVAPSAVRVGLRSGLQLVPVVLCAVEILGAVEIGGLEHVGCL